MTRSIKALAALALAGASILGVTSQASADPNPNNHGSAGQWAVLSTSHGVGIYSSPDAGSSKFNNLTLWKGNDNAVWADCWVVGGNVYNDGDVWYRTEVAYQNHNWIDVQPGNQSTYSWTFAPYVDGAAKFHAVPGLPHC